jgi:FKBP-type peptidyl-prolyl cis-trans isomerase
MSTALEKGKAFLMENGKRPEVTTTASGLQYEVLTPGSGTSPKATDTVLVHYEGTLIDGTIFDSSYQRREPIDFPLNQVISGWTEGVQLMPEGSKFRFAIPSELAYGKRGAGPDIGPDETLIFEVELLKVM